VLGLRPGSLSPQLAEGVARLGSRMPFAQAAEQVQCFWQGWLSDETMRRVTQGAGEAYVAVQAAEAARIRRELPAAPPGPPLQQRSLDGALVPLVGGEWAEVKTAAIGTIVRRLGKDGEPTVHAEDLSSFSRFADAATFSEQMVVELERRGTQTAGRVAAVSDGSLWIQGIIDTDRPDAVRILDFPHAAGYLAQAAQAAYGVDTPQTRAWLDQHTHRLKHQAPEPVLAALRALPITPAADRQAAAEACDVALGYLEARREQVRYADFQRQGLPIGSGAVESACKLVVEARLKGSGMHWARDNVTPMVALRTIVCSQRWGEAWPLIVERQRQQDRERHQRRHRQRHAVPLPAAAPPAPPNWQLLRSAARTLRARRRCPRAYRRKAG
jgi:hypothetical protein